MGGSGGGSVGRGRGPLIFLKVNQPTNDDMTEEINELQNQIDAIGRALVCDDLSGFPLSTCFYSHGASEDRFLIQGRGNPGWLDTRYSFRTLIEAMDFECRVMADGWPNEPGISPGETRIARIKRGNRLGEQNSGRKLELSLKPNS